MSATETILLEEELFGILYENQKLDYLIKQIHHQNKFLNNLNQKVNKIMLNLTSLQQAVTDNTTAINAAIAKLQSPQTTQADIDAITSTVTSNNTALNAVLNPPTAV